MKKIILLTMLPLIMIAKPVYVDEILTQDDSFKLDMSVSYSNIQSSNGISSLYSYQTQNGDFVDIPTYFGASKINQDYINYAMTLRYGVTKDLELFTSANFYTSNTNSSLGNVFESDSSKGFNSLNVGLTYQIKQENETPSILIGFSTNVVEKTQYLDTKYTNRFKNHRIYATSFYTVDPVVFLLTSSYGISTNKNFGKTTLNNGNIFTFSPQVYFAVNPYTSLNWGVKYTYNTKDEINGEQVSGNQSDITFLMGMSYELSAKTIMNIKAEYLNTNDITQSSVSTTFSYKF